MRCIYIVRSLYFGIFSASFLITFLFPEIATSINIHVPFPLSLVIKSGLLLGVVLLIPQYGYLGYYYYFIFFISVLLLLLELSC